MHEVYGIDLHETSPLWTERSWRWLACRIGGLFSLDSRLRRAMFPPKTDEGS